MPAHVYVVVECVERPQPKPGYAAHVGARLWRRWQRPVLPLRALKTLIAARASKSKNPRKNRGKAEAAVPKATDEDLG
jgi:hypothetical protein